MATWRCPHCATPQAEASRCWVCGRSSVNCSTCRNFRRSVADRLGYCGLDPTHAPLRGDEQRGCWQAPRPPQAGGFVLSMFGSLDEPTSEDEPASTPRGAGTPAAVSEAPMTGARPAPGPGRLVTRRVARGTRDPGPAIAVETSGRLVEAPVVRPSRSIAPTPFPRRSPERERRDRLDHRPVR